jgi:hypothetical protein
MVLFVGRHFEQNLSWNSLGGDLRKQIQLFLLEMTGKQVPSEGIKWMEFPLGEAMGRVVCSFFSKLKAKDHCFSMVFQTKNAMG